MSVTRGQSPDIPNDNFPTPPWATLAMLGDAWPVLVDNWQRRLTGARPVILDPACGEGAILKAMADAGVPVEYLHGRDVRDEAVDACTDMLWHAAGGGHGVEARHVGHYNPTSGGDFLSPDWRFAEGPIDAIVMNPPYGGRKNWAWRFVALGLERVRPGGLVVALLRTNFLADGASLTPCRPDWLRDGRMPFERRLDRRPSFTGKGADATTYCWAAWRRGVRSYDIRGRLLRCTEAAINESLVGVGLRPVCPPFERDRRGVYPAPDDTA